MSDRTPPSPDQLVGRTLGKYEITRVLGKGGMATVYQATDSRQRREVAIKVPTPEVASDPEALRRFDLEGQLAARVRSPNIVEVYGIGIIRGVNYIAMEYVKGYPLSRVIQRARQLTPGQALAIARQVAHALIEVHKHKIYHRDIKPKNLILNEEGIVKLMDFGVAERDTDVANEGERWVGTPGYLAPEQIQHLPSDHRSDIYSLGIVLFEMLAGKVPFDSRNGTTLYKQIATDPIPSLRRFNAAVSLELERIIEIATAKRPDARYQTAEALYTDLARELSSIETRTGERVTLIPLIKRMGEARDPNAPEVDFNASQIYESHATKQRRLISIPWRKLGVVIGSLLIAAAVGAGAWFAAPLLKTSGTRALAKSTLHKGEAHTAAVAARGTMLLTGGEDGRIMRTDLAAVGANPLRLLLGPPRLAEIEGGPMIGHGSDVLWLESTGGRAFSSGTDTTFRAWDVAGCKESWRMKLGNYTIQHFALLPGGERALAACSDYKLRLINLEQHSVAAALTGHSTVVYAVSVSPDGARAVSGDAQGKVIFWNLAGPTSTATGQAGTEVVSGVDFSPKGDRVVTAGWDGAVRFWDAASGRALESVSTGASSLRCVAFAGGGRRILTGGDDGVIRVLNAEGGAEVARLTGHKGAVLCVIDTPDPARFVSTGSDGTVRVWQLSPQDRGEGAKP